MSSNKTVEENIPYFESFIEENKNSFDSLINSQGKKQIEDKKLEVTCVISKKDTKFSEAKDEAKVCLDEKETKDCGKINFMEKKKYENQFNISIKSKNEKQKIKKPNNLKIQDTKISELENEITSNLNKEEIKELHGEADFVKIEKKERYIPEQSDTMKYIEQCKKNTIQDRKNIEEQNKRIKEHDEKIKQDKKEVEEQKKRIEEKFRKLDKAEEEFFKILMGTGFKPTVLNAPKPPNLPNNFKGDGRRIIDLDKKSPYV